MGNLLGGQENTFDVTTAAFTDQGAKLYDFPRNENCKLQYCNVEGLAWVDGGGNNGAAASGDARVPQVSGSCVMIFDLMFFLNVLRPLSLFYVPSFNLHLGPKGPVFFDSCFI